MASLPLISEVCIALLAIAASSDAAARRVPNSVVVPIGALGLMQVWAGGGPVAALLAVAGAAAVGTAGWVAWRRRMFGGGDVKLLAASAVYVGWSALPLFLLSVAIFGGALSVLTLVAHQTNIRTGFIQSAGSTIAPGGAARTPRVPYALAIAAGAAYAVWSRGVA